MRKDKKQIIGEPMTDEQIKVFLNAEPTDNNIPASLHKLLRAYHSLRIEDFERFLIFFKEQALNLDAQNSEGQNFTDILAEHRLAKPYIAAFEKARA